jgi:hypothetical protein
VMLAEEGHVTAGEEVRMSGKPVRTETKVSKVSWTKIMRKNISVADSCPNPSPNWIQDDCKFTSFGHQKTLAVNLQSLVIKTCAGIFEQSMGAIGTE